MPLNSLQSLGSEARYYPKATDDATALYFHTAPEAVLELQPNYVVFNFTFSQAKFLSDMSIAPALSGEYFQLSQNV